jgi:hypothetical protein
MINIKRAVCLDEI